MIAPNRTGCIAGSAPSMREWGPFARAIPAPERQVKPWRLRMSKHVSPAKIAAGLTELWSPRVVASLDDSYVKVAKVQGTFGWHAHDDEDELFYVLGGRLRIEMADGAVELDEGDAYVVPRGVRHNPVAERECLVMLIERKTTLHTGSEISERTRSVADQLRPV
jgi:mannose-6-phosphate isomerase-like protein (cupin superfamily)